MKSEYQLFVCDISGQHEPVASFEHFVNYLVDYEFYFELFNPRY